MNFDEIERLSSEDGDDRLDREAHGFTYEDEWRDGSLLCRNGCGLSYLEIVEGKMRQCRFGIIKIQDETDISDKNTG